MRFVAFFLTASLCIDPTAVLAIKAPSLLRTPAIHDVLLEEAMALPPLANSPNPHVNASAGLQLRGNRWKIAVSGFVMQLMLGTIYGWSVFKTPVMQATGWKSAAVGAAFTIAISCLGLAASIGGRFLNRLGPQKMTRWAAIAFGTGTLLTSVAIAFHWLPLLWIGYGVLGGIGIGLGYVTPLTVLLKWFPDKRGPMLGFAVMGFGLGAASIGMIVPRLMALVPISTVFLMLSLVYFLTILIASQYMSNPPSDFASASSTSSKERGESVQDMTFSDTLKTFQYSALWLVLFLNVTAGLALISNLSPLAQKMFHHVTPTGAGVIVIVTSICNGLGRLGWASLSEKIGRKNVFLILLSTQAILIYVLPKAPNIYVFTAISCYILSCYGGGFGTMPLFVRDAFGEKHMGANYGTLLTAWSAAGIVGPQVLMEYFAQDSLSHAAKMLLIGFGLMALYRPPKRLLSAV